MGDTKDKKSNFQSGRSLGGPAPLSLCAQVKLEMEEETSSLISLPFFFAFSIYLSTSLPILTLQLTASLLCLLP